MKRLSLLVLAAAVTAACGTTVPVAQQQLVSTGDGLGNGPGAVDQGASAPVVPGGSMPLQDGTGGSVTTPGQRPGTSRPGATATSAPTVTAPVPSSVAQSTAPVKVAVLYLEGADQLAASLGIGLTTGDARAQAKAIFDHLNAQGGLAGRTISPVYYGMQASDVANNMEQTYATACTALTQDLKVSFVISYLNPPVSAIRCLSKANVTFLDDVSLVADDVQATYRDHFSAPGDFAPGRMLTLLVDGLWSTGWLNATSKVGSYTFDTPTNKALVDGALTQALAKHGLKIEVKAAVSQGAGGVNESSNAALKYRTQGVDRIIPVSANPLFVMNAASSQGYHPQYALYSSLGPGALMEGTAPKDQLAGAAGIGWQPQLDIGAGNRGPAVSANETRCFDLMRKTGQASTAPTVRGFQLSLCNVAFFLQAAAAKVGSVPADVVRRASPLIGTSYQPANTFRTDVSRRVDGAAGFKNLAYKQDCTCFQYTSGVLAAP